MYPHERTLVEKLSDKPFALIGVNSDKDLDKIRGVVGKKNLNWRSFWEGDKGTVSRPWKIRGWPTIFVLDAEGKIRYKGHGGPEVDETILSLLAEMGHDDIKL